MSFKVFPVLILGLLAACGTMPRGAGLESEVLAQNSATTTTDAAATSDDFAVEPITGDSLAKYAAWPAVGEIDRGWITRVDHPHNRIIAPGDMVTVSIWSTEANGLLTTPGQRFVQLPPAQVSSTGQIFLPYIGSIKISGMSPDHARSTVESAYMAVTPSAQVQLSMAEGRQSTVSLVGGVAQPGPFPLIDQAVTVLDAIAASGGVMPSLNNPQIRLQRNDRTYGISMQRLLSDTSLNTTLQGGDRIYVEEDKRYFLSLGAAGSKAQHKFPQDTVSALDAMSIIGGLAPDRANAQGILVLRHYPEKAVRQDGKGPRNARTIFTIDLTTADGLFSAGEFRIRSGDLIYVTESPLIGSRNIISMIGSVFGLAVQAGKIPN